MELPKTRHRDLRMPEQRPKILITTPTLGFLEGALSASYETLRLWEMADSATLSGVRVLTCLGHEILAPVLDRVPDLKLVACYTTGYDGIDVQRCRNRGIAITHAPRATAHAVAEYALALILASFRNVVSGSQVVLAGQWGPGKVLMGRSLKGARLGIVGLGDIGRTLAQLAEALGMQVQWWGPRTKPNVPWPRAATLIDLARCSDVLAVCAKADGSNRHLISAEVFAAMTPTSIFVNVARGQLVDEEALIRVLRAGRLGGAALDVFETEPTPADRWKGVPNVIVTPHIAGATHQSVATMSSLLLENLGRFFSGAPLATPIP